jgi:chorismate mutase
MRKKGIDKPGHHASFYFDVFLLDAVIIDKTSVVNRGLCTDKSGAFSIWRNQQEKLGLLEVEQTILRNGKPSVKYRAGPLTLEYLNQQIIVSQQIATRRDIEASEEKIYKVTEDLQKQINEMQGMLKVVAKAYFAKNPPHNDEREEKLNENLKHGKAYLDEDQPLN